MVLEKKNDWEAFVDRAAAVGRIAREHSSRHDRDGSFVDEAFTEMRSSGYLAMPVPIELGGLGATVAQIACAQAELAGYCAATALASSMHLHVVATNAWRWRHGAAAAEKMLRRVASENLVIASTGGTDRAQPSGTATRVEGGWRVNGRKVFASQAPTANLASTWFVSDDPADPKILGMAIPLNAEGVQLENTWDTLGMRGTGSHDLVFKDVFVTDAQVAGTRPVGELDPILRLAYIHAMTVVSGTYWGIARSAGNLALEQARAVGTRLTAVQQHVAGEIVAKLNTLRWTMTGLFTDLGDDPADSVDNVVAVMLAKRVIAVEGLSVADLAMELAGGRSYYRTQPFEQAWRDLRAAKYHPWTPEGTLRQAGRWGVGLPLDEA